MDHAVTHSDAPSGKKHWRSLLTRRGVQRVAYGVILALLVLSSVEAYRVQWAAGQHSLDIHRRYARQDETLNELRRTIWLGGNRVRDFFIKTNPETARELKSQLRALRSDSERALAQLGQIMPAGSDWHVVAETVQEFWQALEPIPDTMLQATNDEQYNFVQREIVPRRGNLSQAIRELADASRKAIQSSETEFSETRTAASRRLILMLGLCVILAGAVARFSLRYTENLERAAERQYEEVAEAKRELEQLSARLVEIEEEWKKRLSRELHDEIGQSLAVLQIEISHLAAQADSGRPEFRHRLARAREIVERTVRTVRNVSSLLRPAMLDDLGLVPALEWLTEDFARRSGIGCDFSETSLDIPLPDAIKTCVYRVVQEGLHNCEKHSGATRVRVSARCEDNLIRLELEDNGRGFEPKTRHAAGQLGRLGILGMRERVARLGGALELQSSPGAGTVLMARIPLPRPAAGQDETGAETTVATA